jgi:hypothetical protein
MKSADSVLAALAGYVDTLSFVALFVLIGAEATGFGQGVFIKVVAYVAILVGSWFERSVPFPIRV